MLSSRLSLRRLRALVRDGGVQLPFDTIVETISSNSSTLTYYVFIRHKRLFDVPARFEMGDFLVFPYFSFTLNAGQLQRFASISEADQRTLLNIDRSSFWSIETPYVLVLGHPENQKTLRSVSEILHDHFVTNELDAILGHAVSRLMQNVSSSPARTVLYEQLTTLNATKFALQTAFCTFASSGVITPTITNLSDVAILDDDRIVQIGELLVKFRQSQSTVVRFSHHDYFVKAIPIKQGSRLRVVGMLLLVSIANPIEVLAARFNEIFVAQTNDSRLAIGRDSIEKQIQDRIIDVSRAHHSRVDDSMADFCKFVLMQLGNATGSHSATVRRYNSYTNTLDVVSSWSVDDKVEPATQSLPVDREHSVNSYCYQLVPDREYVYIPDVRRVPSTYSENGLTNVLVTRRDTQSEFCLPIGLLPIRFGTLNLESSLLGTYEQDIEFLRSASFHISDYWDRLNSVGDAWWLSQLSLTHLATHELRDFKRQLSAARRSELEHILYATSPFEHLARPRAFTWQSFLEFLRREHMRNAPTVPFTKVWQIEGIDPSSALSAEFQASLRLIAHAILSNTRHSEYELNRIILRQYTATGSYDVVEITYNSNINYLDLDTLEEIENRFRVPSLSKDGWHFGLFLVGVHARLLGGSVEIQPECRKSEDYAPFSYRVRVPLERTADADRVAT